MVMMILRTLSIAGILLSAVAQDPWEYGLLPDIDPDQLDWPVVKGLKIAVESLEEHHTNHFELDAGFAVRRGQSFDIIVTCNTGLQDDDEIFIGLDMGENETAPVFNILSTQEEEDSTYRLKVMVPVDSPIGKYDNLIVFVGSKGDEKDGEEVLYEYPFPVYILFNPWIPEDKVVYLPTESLRKEHVLNDYGLVFDGSIHSHRSIRWFYGPSKQVALDAAFHVLSTIDRNFAGDALKVILHMSRNQGFHRMNPKSPVGNTDGLLEGKWGGNFSDGTNPDLWTSTIDILNQWQETGHATKYGQCWVFGALQTTLMRSLGVGARQLSAFGAMVDASAKKDHKIHHVVDSFFNKDGTVIERVGMVWNYHSWNSVWINREDNATLTGWHSLDGTPPGMGPASDIAVKEQREDVLFNTSSIISYVKSTVRDFLVECKPDHKKMDGCKVLKQLSYDPHGVKLILTSQTLPDGDLAPKVITYDLVDPVKDAFIPFNSSNVKSNLRPTQAPTETKKVAVAQPQFSLKVVPGSHRVSVGNPIEGEVKLKRSRSQSEKPFNIELVIKADLVDRQGRVIREVYRSAESIHTDYRWTKLPLHFRISPDSYLEESLFDTFIKVTAFSKSNDQDHVTVSTSTIVLDPPTIKSIVSKDALTGLTTLRATTVNPHPFPLKKVCMTVHVHDASFEHADEDSTKRTSCKDLQPNESLVLLSNFRQRRDGAVFRPVISLSGPYLPSGLASVQ